MLQIHRLARRSRSNNRYRDQKVDFQLGPLRQERFWLIWSKYALNNRFAVMNYMAQED